MAECNNYEYAVYRGDELWDSGFSNLANAEKRLAERKALIMSPNQFHIRRRPYGEWERFDG